MCSPCSPSLRQVGLGLFLLVLLSSWLSTKEGKGDDTNVLIVEEGTTDMGQAKLTSTAIVLFSIAIPHVQVCLLMLSFDFNWPPYMHSLALFVKGIAILDFSAILMVDCMTFDAEGGRYLFKFVLRLLSICGSGALFGALFCLRGAEGRRHAKNAFLASYSFLFVTTAQAALCLLAWSADSTTNDFPVRILGDMPRVDDTKLEQKAWFWSMQASGYTMVALFLALLPLGALIEIWLASRAKVAQYDAEKNVVSFCPKIWHSHFTATMGSFYEKYGASRWWWEGVVLLRRGLVVGALTMLGTEQADAVLMVALVLLAGLGAQLAGKPYCTSRHVMVESGETAAGEQSRKLRRKEAEDADADIGRATSQRSRQRGLWLLLGLGLAVGGSQISGKYGPQEDGSDMREFRRCYNSTTLQFNERQYDGLYWSLCSALSAVGALLALLNITLILIAPRLKLEDVGNHELEVEGRVMGVDGLRLYIPGRSSEFKTAKNAPITKQVMMMRVLLVLVLVLVRVLVLVLVLMLVLVLTLSPASRRTRP